MLQYKFQSPGSIPEMLHICAVCPMICNTAFLTSLNSLPGTLQACQDRHTLHFAIGPDITQSWLTQ